MTIYLDKYGILIDGRAREGFLLISHPDYHEPLSVLAADEYEGPIPTIHNIINISCQNTAWSRIKLALTLLRWLFSNDYKHETITNAHNN